MTSELLRISGIGPAVANKLNEAGIRTVEEITSLKPQELVWIKGIGINSAEKIIKNAKELINLENGIVKVLDAIKERFIKSCPKCGGEMESKFIILGPERRVGAFQCKLCKFYLPK